jgi:hypothetical protein
MNSSTFPSFSISITFFFGGRMSERCGWFLFISMLSKSDHNMALYQMNMIVENGTKHKAHTQQMENGIQISAPCCSYDKFAKFMSET